MKKTQHSAAFIMVLLTSVLCSSNSFCIDSTSVNPESVHTTISHIMDAPPPLPSGYTFTLPQHDSAACPANSIAKKEILFAKQAYTREWACLKVGLATSKESGEYTYPRKTNAYSTISEQDALILITTYGGGGSGSCKYTNYIRRNWFQTQGRAEHPTDCTTSVNVSCITGNAVYIYNISPAEYSTTPYSPSSNYITYTERTECLY
jgi:hypothetical protein